MKYPGYVIINTAQAVDGFGNIKEQVTLVLKNKAKDRNLSDRIRRKLFANATD